MYVVETLIALAMNSPGAAWIYPVSIGSLFLLYHVGPRRTSDSVCYLWLDCSIWLTRQLFQHGLCTNQLLPRRFKIPGLEPRLTEGCVVHVCFLYSYKSWWPLVSVPRRLVVYCLHKPVSILQWTAGDIEHKWPADGCRRPWLAQFT
jgi:hypothetical protein